MTDPKYLDKPEDVQKMYDPRREAPSIEDLQEEVRPTTWHHNYSWGAWRQNILPMLPMIVLFIPILYLMNPFILKPPWVISTIICIEVIFFALYIVYIIVPAYLAARHFYDSSTVYMGQSPCCGLERIIAYYPVSEPEFYKPLEPFNIQQFRQYLRALKDLYQKRMATQRQLLARHGLTNIHQVKPEEQKPTDPIKELFTEPPKRTFRTYINEVFDQVWTYLGIGLLGATIFLPYLSLLHFFFGILMAPLLLFGILTLVLGFVLPARRRPKPKPPTKEGEST